MKTKVLEQKKDRITVLVEGAGVPLVNALRRACINSVPTMAVEDVAFTKNSSPFYDEIIAHRAGLIPLTTDYSYKKTSECTCKGEGCSRCQVTLALEKKEPGYVYASDMKSSDPKVKPVHPGIIITYLGEGQEISFEATARLGTGKEHAKWSPGLAYHKFSPIISVDNKKTTKDSKKIVDACPKNVLDWKQGRIVVKKLENCTSCKACVKVSENKEISVEPDKTKIIFTFESWGQLPVKTVLEKALDTVSGQLKELKR